jgi:hypothetical protein
MRGFRLTRKTLISILLIVILTVSVAATVISSSANKLKPNPNAYIGVAFGGSTIDQAKLLIDRVSSYTNLFVLDSGRNPISRSQTSVEEICDYAVSKDLSIIINLGVKDYTNSSDWGWFWSQQSLDEIKQRWIQRWENKFLGIYYNDELGGIQIDANWTEFYQSRELPYIIPDQASENLHKIYLKMAEYNSTATQPNNYGEEADFFVQNVLKDDLGLTELNRAKIKAFTSDYCLYWWDYLGGYDTMFAELGWNSSVSQQIALVKGAARLQDKEWGTIITWKYDQAPYLDSGDMIYNQMLTSYEAGANYIVVFNYPYVEGNQYGVLSNEQFLAMQRFWNDINNGKFVNHGAPDAVLVLPHNYGWGMRSPNDTIWGFWPADGKSPQVGLAVSTMLAKYGTNLDIVFEDNAFPVSNGHYKQIYYWNQTIS